MKKTNVFTMEKDIEVFCVTAKSFPGGVLEAHQKLHGYVPFSIKRKYFGISAPDKSGIIIYRSAAEELVKGDLSKYALEKFIIKKGEYIFIDIKDFRKNIPAIDAAFKELISNPGIDPGGSCIEWYMDENNCRCMVRLND